jgi:hypothetical protein
VPVSPEWPKDSIQAEDDREFAARVASRMRPKFTLDLQAGFAFIEPQKWHGDTSVAGITGVMLFGYRRSYQPKFGILFRSGIMLGHVSLDFNGNSSTASMQDHPDSTMAGLVLEVAPFFGPFGRFQWGPTAFLGYLGYTNETLWRAASETTVNLSSGVMFGPGVVAEFMLGDREQVALNVSVRLDLNPQHDPNLFLLAGMGFHRGL